MSRYYDIRQMMVNQLYWYDYIVESEEPELISDDDLVRRFEDFLTWRYHGVREETRLLEEFKDLVVEKLLDPSTE